jgi:hypothetical protein
MLGFSMADHMPTELAPVTDSNRSWTNTRPPSKRTLTSHQIPNRY